MRLSKKKSVEITKELWQWLAQNPKNSKGEWDGWAKYGTMRKPRRYNCPLCEYVAQRGVLTCDYCPLLGWWTGVSGSECILESSPYTKWVDAQSIEDKIKYANEIVALCDKWLIQTKK